MIELNLKAQHSQTYDVYFTVSGGPHFVMWNKNHGITVGDNGLSFAVDGQMTSMAFADIAAIHLSSGTVGEDVIDQCKIEFNAGNTVTAFNTASGGLSNNEQTRIYRDFVYDLHGRLAGAGAGQNLGKISFTAGMSGTRYNVALIALIVAGLFFVLTPLVLAFITGDPHALILMATGVFLVWPFMRVVGNNTPRNYTPDALPDELLS
jgi:hypothetical protein